mgnify:CR=1 FL=1
MTEQDAPQDINLFLMTEKIIEERNAAERKAWDALARYKFYMAGYWMAAWVKYNDLLLPGNGRARNPFRDLVLLARKKK